MQKQSAEANHWLKTALDGDTDWTVALDAYLHLLYVVFFMGQEAEALEYLHAHLDVFVKNAKQLCAGCCQVCGEDAPMLTCGGCRVARSVSPPHACSITSTSECMCTPYARTCC